jgi:hypothetical protein
MKSQIQRFEVRSDHDNGYINVSVFVVERTEYGMFEAVSLGMYSPQFGKIPAVWLTDMGFFDKNADKAKASAIAALSNKTGIPIEEMTIRNAD